MWSAGSTRSIAWFRRGRCEPGRAVLPDRRGGGNECGLSPTSRVSTEPGAVTPSADALGPIAQVLDVLIDHLLIDGIARRSLHDTTDEVLGERLHQLAKLGEDDRAALLDVIDAYITRNRLRTITTPAG